MYTQDRSTEQYNQDIFNREYDYSRIPDDLDRLENLDNWQIREDEPDPRGWEVIGRNNESIGKIDSLLASPSEGKALFAIVNTGGWFDNKTFTIPLDHLQFDVDEHKVYGAFDRERFHEAPEYREGARDWDTAYTYWSGAPVAATGMGHERVADERTEEVRVPVTEERAEVHKNRRRLGYVNVHKDVDVETEHISEPVTKTHVNVETRDVNDPNYTPDPNATQLRDGETLRVPVVEEEVTVEKRPRVTQEVVVTADKDTEMVERDVQLRKEHVEVEEDDEVSGTRR